MKNKLIVLLILFSAIACNKYDELITTWYYTSDELEEWLSASDIESFIMVDQNGISREFRRYENSHNFSLGSSYFIGIKHSMSQKEDYYQSYRSNFLDSYSLLIGAAFGEDDQGDNYWGEQINIRLNDLHFQYDFKFNEILDLYLNDQSKHVFISTAGIEDTLLNSKVTILDTFSLDNSQYGKTLHFQLDDLQEYWNNETITELYYTQGTGLIYYKYNSGFEFKRTN